jgi:drug/metabolite transporter (DMT)-like permease
MQELEVKKHTIKYRNLLGVLLVFIGAVLFSGKAILVKLSYHHNVDAVTLLTLRMIFSLPFYIAIIIYTNLKSERPNVSAENWLKIIFLGIVGYYLASYFDFTGLKYITASLERLILFIYPTLVVIISFFVFKRPIRRKEIFALILTYGGIIMVVLNDLSFSQKDAIKGSILIFFSALTYAMYLIGSGKLIPVLGTVRFTAYAMIVSTIIVIIHFLFLEHTDIFHLDHEVYFLSMVMAVFSTVIPSFFISEGIGMVGSSRASIVGSVGPVSTIILAYIFLGESISFNQLGGTILVLAGVLIVGSTDEFWRGNTKRIMQVFPKRS